MPGIYISWPFCAQKCTFCNFASGVQPRELERQYLEVLLGEVDGHVWAWSPETLYLGGGTPGSMGTAALSMLGDKLPRNDWREATMEAAPGLLTADRRKGLARGGH